jgi:hypothetical protein
MLSSAFASADPDKPKPAFECPRKWINRQTVSRNILVYRGVISLRLSPQHDCEAPLVRGVLGRCEFPWGW